MKAEFLLDLATNDGTFYMADKNYSAVEIHEITACKEHVQRCVDAIDAHDREILGVDNLKRFFEIAYWREKYLDLLLERD